MMGKKGRLNPHLDYSLHPKIMAQRKFNLNFKTTPPTIMPVTGNKDAKYN